MIIWIAIGCGLKRIFQHPHPILPPMLQDLILAANSDDSQATTLFAILITHVLYMVMDVFQNILMAWDGMPLNFAFIK